MLSVEELLLAPTTHIPIPSPAKFKLITASMVTAPVIASAASLDGLAHADVPNIAPTCLSLSIVVYPGEPDKLKSLPDESFRFPSNSHSPYWRVFQSKFLYWFVFYKCHKSRLYFLIL